MAAIPKIHYFPFPGRAEFIKVCFEAVDAKYELVSVPFPGGNTQPEYKNKLYFGQLPFYEEGNFTLNQTSAITRYVAKKLGLYPENPQDAARCEMAFDGVQELFNSYVHFFFAKSIQQADFEKTANHALKGLERALGEYNEGKEYFSAKLSFADLALWIAGAICNRVNHEILKAYPKLHALHAKIGQMPTIAAYVAANFRVPKPAAP